MTNNLWACPALRRRHAQQVLHQRSDKAVDRNGGRLFRKGCFVKGAKRRLRRSETLDKTILSKFLAAIAIDGALRPVGQVY
jgi:hypothetical protein